MKVEFNHTILSARDARTSACFLAEILALPEPRPWGPFWTVVTDNGVSLDYMEVEHGTKPQHYAFLVDEAGFDEILTRVRRKKLSYWADPEKLTPGWNERGGGRGFYFDDPNGHLLEVITRPYGSAGAQP